MHLGTRKPRSRVQVVAAGVFDGIHDGHRYYLRRAKRLGDRLTVIVARDESVSVIKGKRPKRSARQRRAAIAALSEVDCVVLGSKIRSADQDERFHVLLRLKPDVICLGFDQPVHTRALRRYLDAHGLPGTRLVRARRAPHHP